MNYEFINKTLSSSISIIRSYYDYRINLFGPVAKLLESFQVVVAIELIISNVLIPLFPSIVKSILYRQSSTHTPNASKVDIYTRDKCIQLHFRGKRGAIYYFTFFLLRRSN